MFTDPPPNITYLRQSTDLKWKHLQPRGMSIPDEDVCVSVCVCVCVCVLSYAPEKQCINTELVVNLEEQVSYACRDGLRYYLSKCV